ncbi:MAG: DUF1289 domain-containing protein [Melioribacter sp.]|nr:DUF1289 domain-containing protein [Melioribacter sp.]
MGNILQSPCTNNCFVPPGTDICMGCFRSIKEIIDWINLTDNERNEVLKKIDQRKKEHGKTE